MVFVTQIKDGGGIVDDDGDINADEECDMFSDGIMEKKVMLL